MTIGKLADATINALTTDSTPSTVYRFRDESLAPWLPAFTGGVSFFVKSAQPWVNAANGMGLTNGANWQPTWAAPNTFDQSTATWSTREGVMTGCAVGGQLSIRNRPTIRRDIQRMDANDQSALH